MCLVTCVYIYIYMYVHKQINIYIYAYTQIDSSCKVIEIKSVRYT